MFDGERNINRPSNETRKVVLATFKNVIDSNSLSEKVTVTEANDGNGLITLSLDWNSRGRNGFINRQIEVVIFERHLEVWACIWKLHSFQVQMVVEKKEQVEGPVRLPLFSDRLQNRIVDAFVQAEDWTEDDLRVMKRITPQAGWTIIGISLADLKPFVDGF